MTKVHFPLLLAALLLVTACSASVDVVSDNQAVVERPTAESATEDPSPSAETPAQAPEPTPEPTAEPTPTPTPLPPGAITVTDTDAVGEVGDDALSLVEGVALANGRLTMGELSDSELAFVTGAPGPTNTDTITVDVPPETPIVLPGGNVWIVELFNNSGDTILGGGATLSGGLQEPGVSDNVMLIGSSDLRISGFVFERVTNAIAIESAGRQLEAITIEDNAFRNIAIRDIALLNSLSGGSLADITVRGNSFDAPERLSDLRTFVAVRGGESLGEVPTEDTFIENVSITDNTMNAQGGTVGTCISIFGGHVPFGQPGRVTGAIVTGVDLSGNALNGCTTAIDIAGGMVQQTNGSVTDSAVTQVSIMGSTINVGSTGVRIHGGWVAPAPPSFGVTSATAASVTGNRVEGIALDSSVLSAFDVGLQLVGGAFDVEGNGAAEMNRVAEVTGVDLTFDGLATVCTATADVGAPATANALDATCDALTP